MSSFDRAKKTEMRTIDRQEVIVCISAWPQIKVTIDKGSMGKTECTKIFLYPSLKRYIWHTKAYKNRFQKELTNLFDQMKK